MKLTNEKNRLNAEDSLGKKRMAENEEKIRNIKKVEDETKKVTEELKNLHRKQKELVGQTETTITQVNLLILNHSQIIDFVKAKDDLQRMKYKITNLQRKIEIAMIAYEKARKFLQLPDFPTFEEFYAQQQNNNTSGAEGN